jgi:hypothetical protein
MGEGASSTPGPRCLGRTEARRSVLVWARHRHTHRSASCRRPKLTGLRQRFMRIHQTHLSLACSPRWWGLLGFTLLLSHASLPDACEGWEPALTLAGVLTTSQNHSSLGATSRRTRARLFCRQFLPRGFKGRAVAVCGVGHAGVRSPPTPGGSRCAAATPALHKGGPARHRFGPRPVPQKSAVDSPTPPSAPVAAPDRDARSPAPRCRGAGTADCSRDTPRHAPPGNRYQFMIDLHMSIMN